MLGSKKPLVSSSLGSARDQVQRRRSSRAGVATSTEHAVAVHAADDAARGDLGLQQADAVLTNNEVLLHGLEEGDLLPGVGVGCSRVTARSPTAAWQTPRPGTRQPSALLHRVSLFSLGSTMKPVAACASRRMSAGAWPEQPLPVSLVDAEGLLGPRQQQASGCSQCLASTSAPESSLATSWAVVRHVPAVHKHPGHDLRSAALPEITGTLEPANVVPSVVLQPACGCPQRSRQLLH